MSNPSHEGPVGTCVLCLKQNAVLTEEHVFPDGIGGDLRRHILCKPCNEKLGQRVDGPYLAQKHVEFAKSAFQVGGKRGIVPQPFSDTYEIAGEKGPQRIRLSADYKPILIPEVSDIRPQGEGVALSLTVDAADREKLPEIIRKKMTRFFKSPEGIKLGWTEEQIERAIQTSSAQALQVPSTEARVQTMLKGSFTVDLKILFLEHVKVAYELAAIEFGESFLGSSRAEGIRQFLLDQIDGKPPARWELVETAQRLLITPQLPDFALNTIAPLANNEPDKFLLGFVTPNLIIVSMLGFGVILLEPVPGFDTEPVVYRNSIETQKCLVNRGDFIAL